MPCGLWNRERKKEMGKTSLGLGLKTATHPHLTGNAQVISRLKIGRIYIVTEITSVSLISDQLMVPL